MNHRSHDHADFYHSILQVYNSEQFRALYQTVRERLLANREKLNGMRSWNVNPTIMADACYLFDSILTILSLASDRYQIRSEHDVIHLFRVLQQQAQVQIEEYLQKTRTFSTTSYFE